MRARRLWLPLVLPGSAWLVLLYLVPVALVVAASFATTDPVGRPVYDWNTENYEQVVQPFFLPVLLRSLLFAVLTVAVCLAIGYPVAYALALYGGRYRTLLVLLILVPWFVDYLVRIYAWVQLLGDDGVVNGLLRELGISDGLALIGNRYALLGGLVYNFLPFMIVTVFVAVEQLDKRLIEAGKDLYGSPVRTFWHVTLPSTAQGAVGGSLLVFLLTLGDFATAQFLGGSQYMVGNLIRDQFSSTGSLPFGSALTVTLLSCLAIALGLYARFGPRGLGGTVERARA